MTHFDKETSSLRQLALDAATDSGVFELMELRTHVCGSGGLGTSCHSMPIIGNASKKVSANKRGKFGLNSADLVAQASHAASRGQVSLKRAAQLAPVWWRRDFGRRLSQPSYQALKRILERTQNTATAAPTAALQQAGPHIRSIEEYQAFWDFHAEQSAHDLSSTTDDRSQRR